MRASVIPPTKFVDLMWAMVMPFNKVRNVGGASLGGKKLGHLSAHTLPFLDDENNPFSLIWLLLFWLRPPGHLSGSWFGHLKSIRQVECLTQDAQQMGCQAETGKQPP